ncbi:hypothetical protein KUTeg_003149 [Tegillarca granosa]|uniref:Uncharacterized protein n=1 Tax=Tegillarca granosa TaxID=220873 RepID=A0ABQ9FQS9_TEGGR|nr:hypothetical protein KUTeg_003149 [Tegillarca granosa]
MVLHSLLCTLIFINIFDFVLSIPTISTQEQNFTVLVNKSVTFPCVVTDTSPIDLDSVNWYFLEHNLHISQGTKIHVIPGVRYKIILPQIHDDSGTNHVLSVTLEISDIQIRDHGHYQCKIKGTDTSVEHSLNVIGATLPPSNTSLSQHFNFTDCCMKEGMSQSCLPSCSPYQGVNSLGLIDATVACANDLDKLLKCGTDGKNHAGCCKRRGVSSLCYDFCLGQVPTSLNENHTLCITQIIDIYACLEEGRVTLPGPPGSVSALSIGPEEILVNWKPPVQNPDLVTGYIVKYKLITDTVYKQRPINRKTKNQVTLNGLKTNSMYDIYVVATSSHGSSQQSETVQMAPIAAPDPTDHFEYLSNCCSQKKISSFCQKTFCNTNAFTKLNAGSIYPCITEFGSILQCMTGERDHSACCKRNNLPEHCILLCKGRLSNPAQALTFDLSTCILNKNLIEGCVYEGYTTIPGVPINVRLTNVTATSAILEWDSGFGGNATFYIPGIRHPNDLKFNLTNVSDQRVVYSELKPGHFYEFVVQAGNNNGTSYQSPQITFLTYELAVTVRPPTTMTPSLKHNFTECCINASVVDVCMPLCNYSTYPEVGLTIDPFYIDNCALDILKIVACGADGRDHTPCCLREGITQQKCLDLCDYTPSVYLDSDAECIKHTAEYAKCFREGIVTHPRHPENVFVTNTTSHTITLSWSSPLKGAAVVKYIVRYSKDFGSNWKEQSTTNTLFIVQGLTPSTLYKMAVISVGANGTKSAMSPYLELYTKQYVPCAFNESTNTKATFFTKNGILSLGSMKVSSQKKCRLMCDDYPPEAKLCIAFSYEVFSQSCIIVPPVYKGQIISVRFTPTTGVSYYQRICANTNPPMIMNGTVLPSWDAYWQTQEDCCNKSSISSVCRPHCLSGEFGDNPNLCSGQDFHQALACASDGKDHTSCCKSAYIPDQCLGYCKGLPPVTDPLSALCLSYRDLYMSCFRKGSGRLPSPPRNFRVIKTSSTYIEVAWNQPSDNCNDGGDRTKICTYEISYWPSGIKEPPENKNTKTSHNPNTFNITGLQSLVAYTIIVVSRNTYGSSLPSPKLDVLTKKLNFIDIVIYQDPSGVVNKGSRVVLTCNVFGNPPPIVYWTFNNNKIHTGRQFAISNVQKQSEGNYSCFADQQNNTPLDKRITYLSIRYKPDIVEVVGDSKRPNMLQTATLKCVFKGHPTTIDWSKKDGNVIVQDARHRFYNGTDWENGKTIAYFKIYNVQDTDYGHYQCNGKNRFGSHLGLLTLTNEYPEPSPLPTLPPKSLNETVRQCCIRYQITGDCLDLCHSEVDGDLLVNNTEKYGKCLDHLEYYIACAANRKDHGTCCKKAGITEFCMPFCKGHLPDVTSANIIECVTDAAKMIHCAEEGHSKIPSPPYQVLSKLKNDEIEVSWSPPLENADKIDYYEVHYNYTGSPEPLEHTVSKNLLFYTFKDIHIQVSYQIWVIAANSFGKSHPAYSRSLYIQNIRPPPPIDVHVEMVNGNTLYLKWTKPTTWATIKEYNIYYKEQGSNSYKKVMNGWIK